MAAKAGDTGVLRLLAYQTATDPHAGGVPDVVLVVDGAPPDGGAAGSHLIEDLDLGDYDCKDVPGHAAAHGLWLLEWPWTLIRVSEASRHASDDAACGDTPCTTARYGDGAWRRPTLDEIVALGALPAGEVRA